MPTLVVSDRSAAGFTRELKWVALPVPAPESPGAGTGSPAHPAERSFGARVLTTALRLSRICPVLSVTVSETV
jgi:hypothetical protein